MITTRNFDTFTAEKVRLVAHSMIGEYPGLENNSEILLHTAENTVLMMKSWCLSGRVPTNTETEMVRWPDGWWQMFKQDLMPRWFLRWFPVQYAERRIATVTNHYFVCPHLVSEPNRDHIRFMATGTDLAVRI